jgi:hypothetical protein
MMYTKRLGAARLSREGLGKRVITSAAAAKNKFMEKICGVFGRTWRRFVVAVLISGF